MARAKKPRRCRQCKQAEAKPPNKFCPACWTQILNEFREVWKDVPMSEKDLEELALSFFVDG